MGIRKYFVLTALLSTPLLAIAQIEYQIGIGPLETTKETIITVEYDNSTSVLFQNIISYGPRAAFLGTYPLRDRLWLRTGIAGQPSQFYGEIFIFQDDPDKKQSLFKDYDYVHLIIPIEAQYGITSWLNVSGGIGVNLLFDITDNERFENSSLRQGLTKSERDVFFDVIDNQVRTFNLSYRASAMLRYKRIGLEFGYEYLFTNVLKPFEYNGTERKETIKYGFTHLKILYLFKWGKPDQPKPVNE